MATVARRLASARPGDAESQSRRLGWAAKRGLDICLSLLGLVILAPFLALIGLLVRLGSRGPALFAARVVGEGGRPFEAYKFRTMVVGAEALKPSLRARNEAEWPIFKMSQDPRVTRLGRFLRRHSLDELPQLWSVLRGDMSLVGPRPVLTEEWGEFTPWQRQKLSIRPGAVSLWHLRGQPRNLDDWVRLDLEYIHNWSLWLDLRILAGTLWYMLAGKNC
jgi:lipopolysaccharide/colanic/teichoic acid biosynthesis glycosyltransferase